MTATTWKAHLAPTLRADWAREIDVFETQIELRRAGKIEEKMFAETRLRRGVYGQRYDNGQRYDGAEFRQLAFPCGPLTKGPQTVFDAPGMQRIKLPFGKVTCEQLEELAACAEEYSDAILHVTTRQDIQLHFVHLEDTPDLMRRLARVGITTREACGNSVRNVTACPFAGVCSTEGFDVAPYANAITWFLMGHDDTQDFGRKFKIAFSGCEDEACGVVNFHDLGAVAQWREVDGVRRRGFRVVVGGGLGAVPHEAPTLGEWVSEEELLPLAQAVCRVFARLGEKENRARARIKFLVKKLGIAEFRRLVEEERAQLRPDPRWTAYLADLHVTDESPLRPPGEATPPADGTPEYRRWAAGSVRPQRQPGYSTVTVKLPLGDLSSDQARALATLCRRTVGDAIRTTVDQNIVLRWVSHADLAEVHAGLVAIGLGDPGANGITDVTSCPGTDTCKLGISSSRGLAGELRRQLTVVNDTLDPAVQALHVKCSGCFNSCGQHHVADVGFLGVSRNVNGRRVPHFQLVVGGQWTKNAGAYGLAIGAVPSKRAPDLLRALTGEFAAERQGSETFQDWIRRVGKKRIRALLDRFVDVPAYEQAPEFFSDWGDPREYTIGDMGVGECAGEVVPFVEMELAAAEREVFEAQLLLEAGDHAGAAARALSAMLQGARALVKREYPNVNTDPAEITAEFRARLFDTRRFHDPFAGPKFAHYFFRAVEEGAATPGAGEPGSGRAAGPSADAARQRLEEAGLFVEACHQCYQRLLAAAAAPVAVPAE